MKLTHPLAIIAMAVIILIGYGYYKEPKNFNDCILQKMPSKNDSVASETIIQACRAKFSEQAKSNEKTGEKLDFSNQGELAELWNSAEKIVDPYDSAPWKEYAAANQTPNDSSKSGSVYDGFDSPITPKLNSLPSRPRSSTSSCESGHWIDSVSDDGSIVKLEDGAIWEVDSYDAIDSALWLPTSDIVVCEGKLINTDDNETVEATQIR